MIGELLLWTRTYMVMVCVSGKYLGGQIGIMVTKDNIPVVWILYL